MGFLAFGMDFPLKRASEGQIAVTDKAVYYGGNAYPLNTIVQVRPGHYSNSVVLTLKQLSEGSMQKTEGRLSASTTEVEFKSSNVKALTHTIEQASSTHP